MKFWYEVEQSSKGIWITVPGWRIREGKLDLAMNAGCRNCQCPCHCETSKQPINQPSSKWKKKIVMWDEPLFWTLLFLVSSYMQAFLRMELFIITLLKGWIAKEINCLEINYFSWLVSCNHQLFFAYLSKVAGKRKH